MLQKSVKFWNKMRLLAKVTAIMCTAVIAIGIFAQSANAAEGSNYRLYGTNDDYLLRTEKIGTNYVINEANYENEPIEGSSYIVYQSPSKPAVVPEVVPEEEVPEPGGLRPESLTHKKYPRPPVEPLRPAAPEIVFVRVGEILERIKELAPIGPAPVVTTRAVPLPSEVRVPAERECPVPPAQQCVPDWTLFWCLLLAILIPWLILFIILCIETYRNRKRPIIFSVLFSILVLIVLLAVFIVSTPRAYAETTVPLKTTYYGYLFDKEGNPLNSDYTVRFSYWSSSDFVTGDVTATGAINTAASTYADWTEVHAIRPNSDGYFFVKLGSIVPLPDFSQLPTSTLLDMYLQVEVKPTVDPDTSYDFLDHDNSSDTEDRNPMLSVPFALNADFIDQREIGTGSGNIVILGSGGIIDIDLMPGGTNSDTWIIDNDNTSTTNIVLQFGDTLNKTLIYDQAQTWFEFNDDVNIDGDLTVTGLINGIDITTLASSAEQLKVSSGGGLTANVAAGGYRISGDTTQYTGTSSVALTANTTNYLFFNSGGLVINTTGFATGASIIPLAEVLTSTGAVTTVTDSRVMQSDDRDQTIEKVIRPGYEGTAYQGDTTNNTGRMFINHDNTNNKNFYQWYSTPSPLQDYDIVLSITLPTDFKAWQGNPLAVEYRSTSGATTENQMDISVFDTNGAPVSLTGSSSDLASTSWQTAEVGYAGSPTWTAGEELVVKLKVHSRKLSQMHVGDVKLRYKILQGS